MSYTLAQRQEALASMPWVAVSPVDFKKRCDGHRRMPLYARLHMSKEEKRARYGCKNRARWVFISLEGEINTYCWWHLHMNGFEDSIEEMERFQKWVDHYVQTHPTEWPDWDPDAPDEPVTRR